MNVWNKVFLGVIIVASIAVLMLASVEFHIRNTGQKHLADSLRRTADAEARIARLTLGDPTRPSIEKSLSDWSLEELRGAVRERQVERGRAWFHCRVADARSRNLPPTMEQVVADIIITGPRVPDAAGALTRVAAPDALRGVVYVFEEREEDNIGAFLGRFTVEGTPTATQFRDDTTDAQISGWRVTLISSDPLCDVEIDQIFGAANLRWAVYLAPPIDRIAGVFDRLTEEERQMIPAEFLERFQPRPMPELTLELIEELIEKLYALIDDPSAEWDTRQDAERAIAEWTQTAATWGQNRNIIAMWEKYRAILDNPEAEWANDYAELLDWLYLHRSNVLRDIETLNAHIATHIRSLEQAAAENDMLENTVIPLEELRFETMEIQRKAVADVLGQYEAVIAEMALGIERLKTLSRILMVRTAEAQFRAAEKIEEQVRRAAGESEGVR